MNKVLNGLVLLGGWSLCPWANGYIDLAAHHNLFVGGASACVLWSMFGDMAMGVAGACLDWAKEGINRLGKLPPE